MAMLAAIAPAGDRGWEWRGWRLHPGTKRGAQHAWQGQEERATLAVDPRRLDAVSVVSRKFLLDFVACDLDADYQC